MIEIEQRPAHEANYSVGRAGRAPDRIVVHIAAGTLEGTAAWFANPEAQVSAHYTVGADGRVYQHVSEADTAWHAGDLEANRRSIGIEHEGFHGPNEAWWSPTEAQLQASAELAAAICRRWSIIPDQFGIVPHSAVNPRKPLCPGPGFPLDSYRALVASFLQPERAPTRYVPVRLFDPMTNEQIGLGTFVAGTDKVYVKSLGPLMAAGREGSPRGG